MANNKLPISIIIPCADDIQIKTCLESIDEKVEIIVALNGASEEVKNIVRGYKVKIIEIPERNLAKAENIGIEEAENKKILLLDSDCRLQKKAIKKLYNAFFDCDVIKGRVIFESNGFLSKIIARVREYIYYCPPKPFNPFLAINKDIKKLIGNYFFDEDIYWTEDADLHLRLKKAGIKVKYFWEAKAFHSPLPIRHDLKSAFRYGIGKRRRVQKGTARGVGSDFGHVLDIALKKGFFPSLYYIVWNCFYSAGFFYQMLFVRRLL